MSRAEEIIKALEEMEIIWHRGQYNHYECPTLQESIDMYRNPHILCCRTTDSLWKEAVSYGITTQHPHRTWEQATYAAMWRGI